MPLDIRTIEQLAPDQSSLKAAAGLAKPAKWSGAATNGDGTLIWGLCAGSGANPYKVAVDLRDNGSKCTCPSRKFPCKHGIALMWMKVQSTVSFPVESTPEWVQDWLGRRRGPPVDRGSAGKDAEDVGGTVAPEDPKAIARREAATAKRLAESDAAIGAAFEALEQWISDQLRTGLAAFVDDATARCRRIASRMVDGKAATLAGRIDEMPSRLLRVPAGDRVRVAIDEMARLVLLSRRFRADPRDKAVRRAIASAETRDAMLTDPGTVAASSTWEVLTERVVTRRDGLISQTTWLLNLGEGPRFAMLLDFHPASVGRRGTSFVKGDQFEADIAFFSAERPLRAVMVSRGDEVSGHPWPRPDGDTVVGIVEPALMADPWCGDVPMLLPRGRILLDAKGEPWWRSECGRMVHPVTGVVPDVARGSPMEGAAAIWFANRLEMLAGTTSWGKVDFDA